MIKLGRRQFLIVVGSLSGVTVASWLLGSRSSPSMSSSLLERVNSPRQTVSPDLLELGRAVNSQSPESAHKTAVFLDQEEEGEVAQVIVGAARDGSDIAMVSIDGWELPDLVAGIAGILAADAH